MNFFNFPFFQLWVRALLASFFHHNSNFGYHWLYFFKTHYQTFLQLNLTQFMVVTSAKLSISSHLHFPWAKPLVICKSHEHVLKSWANHLQTHLQRAKIICTFHLQQTEIICNSNMVCLRLKRSLQHCVKKKKNLLRKQKEHIVLREKSVFRLILVGRSKFKFWTKFVVEAKMMKKLPKKLLHFSPHCWYHFFFHSTVDIHFLPKKQEAIASTEKKGHNPSFSNVAFLPFFAF